MSVMMRGPIECRDERTTTSSVSRWEHLLYTTHILNNSCHVLLPFLTIPNMYSYVVCFKIIRTYFILLLLSTARDGASYFWVVWPTLPREDYLLPPKWECKQFR